MKPLYTILEFNNAKSKDNLSCECYACEKSFSITKHAVQRAMIPGSKNQAKYCSRKCLYNATKTSVLVTCKNCKKEFRKFPSEIKNTEKRNGNHFCSRSCGVTYNNTHKTHGNRRSKLETWIEKELSVIFPSLEIHYNRKDTIKSELDIYIPSIKLAIEINGIFHYKPIFGEDKLKQIQNNDKRKYQACLKEGIELVWIDSSQLTYFNSKNAQKYLYIIIEIINSKNVLKS